MAGRFTLAIEISNPSMPQPGVALGEIDGLDVRLLGTENVRASTREDDDLVPAIDRLFGRAGLLPRDIGVVGVSAGPGGYTSMRMAVAAAKMIAEVSGASCVSVPSSHVAAEQARASGVAGPIAVALAAKGNSAFVTVFDPGSSNLAAPVGGVLTSEQFRAVRASVLIADDHALKALGQAGASSPMKVLPPHLTAEACLRASANLPRIDPAALVPIYARQPEAVTLWQARHPGR